MSLTATFVEKKFYKTIKKNISKQFGNGKSKGENLFTKIIDVRRYANPSTSHDIK